MDEGDEGDDDDWEDDDVEGEEEENEFDRVPKRSLVAQSDIGPTREVVKMTMQMGQLLLAIPTIRLIPS